MKKIILFGAGDYGRKALKFYGADKIECFVDNDPTRVGSIFCEKEVIDFESLIKRTSGRKIIISVSSDGPAALQIASQLQDSGIFDYEVWSPSLKELPFNIAAACARIHSKLGDEISHTIFEHRLLRYLTNDLSYIAKMTRELIPDLDKQINACDKHKLILCNPELPEKVFARIHKGVIHAFIDTSLEKAIQGQEFLGAPFDFATYPFDCANDFEDAIFILPWADGNRRQLAIDGLKRLNVPSERILDLIRFNRTRDQYFDLPYLKVAEDEVFIDAGCFDGSTAKQFLEWAGSGKVFAFEPESKQFEICKRELAGVSNVELINAGLWHEKDILSFSPLLFGGSGIDPAGEEHINAVSLDEHLGNQRVTFIKMDIEGAEVNALKGAKEIIRTQKPKLAISVYHRPEHILTIPETILRINPSYTFYLRHYTIANSETVLYAI